MAFFDWDEKYRIGVESIDAQHQYLFELIGNFYEAVRSKELDRAMTETLQGLVEYAHYHFATEEEYMVEHDYPFYKQHRAQHHDFVQKVTDFVTRYQDGKLLIPLELANFLKNWLSEHILGSDKRIGEYTKS